MNARRRPSQESAPALDMSSLIDVSFLLLVFFLVTSTLDPKESDLAMTLPTDRNHDLAKVVMDQMTVEVETSGDIVVNGETLDTGHETRELPKLLDLLKTYVETAALTRSQTRVVIAADDGVKGQRFIDVLNALADRGISIDQVSISGFSEEK